MFSVAAPVHLLRDHRDRGDPRTSTRPTHFIKELRALGCRFSLDDFGAGMSSFAYLKHLPVDFLKIDGVFVKDMADDPIDRAMVEAINNVGHVMGKQTIAEWVDSDRVIAALREMGVDFAQGFGVRQAQALRAAAADRHARRLASLRQPRPCGAAAVAAPIEAGIEVARRRPPPTRVSRSAKDLRAARARNA